MDLLGDLAMGRTRLEVRFGAEAAESSWSEQGIDVAELPATSVHVPLTDCPPPSPERTVGAGGLPAAKPERLSAHWKLTVTGELFQPFAFAAGVRVPEMLGGVLSI